MPLRAAGEGVQGANGEQRSVGGAQHCKRLEWGSEEETPGEPLRARSLFGERDSTISIWAPVSASFIPERPTRVHSAQPLPSQKELRVKDEDALSEIAGQNSPETPFLGSLWALSSSGPCPGTRTLFFFFSLFFFSFFFYFSDFASMITHLQET